MNRQPAAQFIGRLAVAITAGRYKFNNWSVLPCERNEIRAFIEEWHYSHSINGVMSSYCFKLVSGDRVVGAALYGSMAMANTWKRYVDDPSKIIELRRLCLVDHAPKNAESYFIGKTMKWLRENTSISHVISYADRTHNHEGIIYQATNFAKVGETSPGRMISHDGRLWHDKTIRTKYNGVLKPFAAKLKAALDAGEATYVKTLPKNIYLYEFNEGYGNKLLGQKSKPVVQTLITNKQMELLS